MVRSLEDRRGSRARRRTAFAALMLMLAGLGTILVAQAPSSSAAGLCLPQPKKTACIAGTIGSRSNPIAGAAVTLQTADGVDIESQTTGDDGKYAFEVTEPGDYLLKLDPDTLPDNLLVRPPSKSVEGPDGSLKVKVKALGAITSPIFNVRDKSYQDGPSPKSDQIISGMANGLRLGLLLALASLGLSLIYGTTGISNFAHAEQVTLGGFIAYWLVKDGVTLWVAIILTVIIGAATGYLQDRVLWTPLRRRGLGLTQLMIVTIGLSLAVQYLFQFVVGGSQVKVTLQRFKIYEFGPVRMNSISLIAMGISVVAILAVGFVLLRTRVGQATRAVSDNPALAAASGIDVDRIVRGVWTVSMGLAGLSGVLYVLAVSNGVRWDTGMQILLILFAAVTLGGLGTAFGALVGSLIVGQVVELAGPLGAPGDLKYAVALGLLIVVLVFRPQGLLGKSVRVG